ncbi:MAG: NlpC/P60 family protein [Ginsengibacter sp.]
MKNLILFSTAIFLFILAGCSSSRKLKTVTSNDKDMSVTAGNNNNRADSSANFKNFSANDLISFAETLIGIRYKYGAESVQDGFDCSGFVNYVFNHFNIPVPRVTTDFANAGEEIPIRECKPGDIILFTGSNAKNHVVGHVGIITENDNGDVKFIHASTSHGVMISGMNSYFAPRFIKVNRIFPGGNETIK